MLQRLKQYLLYAGIIAVGYFMLSHHFIYHNKKVFLLPKEELTMEYTFYSLDNKRAETILRVDELRYAGIGELLVKRNLVSREEMQMLEDKYYMEDQE